MLACCAFLSRSSKEIISFVTPTLQEPIQIFIFNDDNIYKECNRVYRDNQTCFIIAISNYITSLHILLSLF